MISAPCSSRWTAASSWRQGFDVALWPRLGLLFQTQNRCCNSENLSHFLSNYQLCPLCSRALVLTRWMVFALGCWCCWIFKRIHDSNFIIVIVCAQCACGSVCASFVSERSQIQHVNVHMSLLAYDKHYMEPEIKPEVEAMVWPSCSRYCESQASWVNAMLEYLFWKCSNIEKTQTDTN